MISIISRPSKTISGETSIWNAVGNPIVYRLRREDYDWDQINNNGGLMQVQINGIDLSTEFTTGDVVYVKSSNGVYDVTATVTGVSFSTNTLIDLYSDYGMSLGAGGYINNITTRPGYYAEINLYNSNDELINESPFVYSTDQRGDVIVDVSSIIRPTLSPDNDFVFGGGDVQDDLNVFASFYIEYLENWTGNNDSLVYQVDDENIFYAILGARQIPAPYGGNMAEYVTWLDRSPLGRWLTKLDKLVMWKEWPSLLSFIAGEMSDADPYRVLMFNNMTPSAHSGIGQTSFDDNVVKMNDLQSIYEGGSFDDEDKTIYAVVINYDFSPPVEESDFITETMEIEVREVCKNPIMLMGRNSLGGVIQWVFEYTQEYTFDYGNDRKARRMVLHDDNLTLNQWEALQDFITLGQVYKNNILELTSDTIKTSTRIGQQVYVVEQDGSKTGVIVIPTRNQTRTRQYRHEFEIEIEYPEVFAV